MKKLNRTYIMGIVFIILALWVAFQTTQIPTKLVSNEPGPKLFPYISAIGMIVMAVLSMIFDGKKEADDNKHGAAPYLDAAGWKRLALIMVECIVFCAAMNVIGFWITSMIGMMVFIMTRKLTRRSISYLQSYSVSHLAACATLASPKASISRYRRALSGKLLVSRCCK